MEITLEMVERLKGKANVSYKQAKEALEYSGGNMLDALIYLEEKESIPRDAGAYYSRRRRRRRPGRPGPEEAAAGSLPPCAAGWWTMSWKSGGKVSLSPPCRC